MLGRKWLSRNGPETGQPQAGAGLRLITLHRESGLLLSAQWGNPRSILTSMWKLLFLPKGVEYNLPQLHSTAEAEKGSERETAPGAERDPGGTEQEVGGDNFLAVQ